MKRRKTVEYLNEDVGNLGHVEEHNERLIGTFFVNMSVWMLSVCVLCFYSVKMAVKDLEVYKRGYGLWLFQGAVIKWMVSSYHSNLYYTIY